MDKKNKRDIEDSKIVFTGLVNGEEVIRAEIFRKSAYESMKSALKEVFQPMIYTERREE